MSHITAIETSLPKNKILQKDALAFMVAMNAMNEQEAHDLEVLYRATGIESRHSVLADYGKLNDYEFYNSSKSSLPTTSDRMDIYRNEAPALALDAARKCLKQADLSPQDITHLVTVSCTGMYAPGLDIDIVSGLKLAYNTERYAINYMGCYAAFNALKMAHAFCQIKNAKVLVVCLELCSLHFQLGKDQDNLLANALFADGCAALIMETKTNRKKSLSVNDYSCDLLPQGKNEMAWNIGNFGFEMKLSTYVPDIIATGIEALLNKYHAKAQHFAIHPGGKKILQVIEQHLGIDKSANRHAHEVLRKYGNMSSPTVLFVLKSIFDSASVFEHNDNILAMAFGPGLTLESMTFTINSTHA